MPSSRCPGASLTARDNNIAIGERRAAAGETAPTARGARRGDVPGQSRRAALVYTDRAEDPHVALSIEPITRPFDAVVELPGSKSYSNRALLVAALARGRSEITRALFSDDTRYMHGALEALGARLQADEISQAFTVDGVDGRFPASEATLETRTPAPAARFLPPAVAIGRGTFVIDGSPAMRKRPIQPLLDGLRALGVDAEGGGGPRACAAILRASI